MRFSSQAGRLASSRVEPTRPVSSLIEDARAGLLQRPRQLPPKYFYDDHGSELFEAICATPEYYPSRTEAALLAARADTIIERTAPEHILELGSGSARKTRYLLDACDRLASHCQYWPFDVSAQMMLDAGAELVVDYEWLAVHALIGDYTGGLQRLGLPQSGRRLILFLGGTLGNFEPAAANAMLKEIASLMGSGDALLLGLDRVKARERLEAAYNDAEGVTAAFNRNVLTVLNRELGADFPAERYRHRAVFDEQHARIEMRLAAEHAHRVTLPALDAHIDVECGEEILTEISRKFTPESIARLLRDAGLSLDAHHEADNGDYSLILAGLSSETIARR